MNQTLRYPRRDAVLTVSEVAMIYGVSARRVYHLIVTGRLKSVDIEGQTCVEWDSFIEPILPIFDIERDHTATIQAVENFIRGMGWRMTGFMKVEPDPEAVSLTILGDLRREVQGRVLSQTGAQ